MRILGLSAFYHDSAAALVEGGRIVAAAQEERFTRKKHDAGYPANAVACCLDEAGVTLNDVDRIVFYDKPFLKFERLLETYVAFAPRGFRSFSMAVPVWIKEKLFQKDLLRRKLRSLAPDVDWDAKLLFAEHHQSHAASAFYPSPFHDAVVLTMDGVGEWATTSVGIGHGNDLEMTREIHFPHSLGLLYSAFTYYTGFKVNSGEYKVMGLAPYGEPKYVRAILDNLIDLKPDGTFRLDLDYFDYCTGLTMTNGRFETLFGGPARQSVEPLTQRHMDLAASVQAVIEEAVLRLTRSLRAETGLSNLCLAGGVALNCVANGKVLRDGQFDEIWIQPAAGDAGGALGAALAASHRLFGEPRPSISYWSSSGAIQSSGEAVQSSDEAAQSSDGAIQSSGGAAQNSGGAVQSSGGAIQSSDGAAQSSDGAIQSSDGAVQSSGGAIQSSDGAIQSSGGAIQSSDEAIQSSDGAIQSSGEAAQPRHSRVPFCHSRESGNPSASPSACEKDAMHGAFLGPEFSLDQVRRALDTAGARYETLTDNALIDATASALAVGQAVGWFQGRMEFGPRALGNRSILADARSPTMQKTLNLKVKHRESFRPFAPSVSREDVADWFDLDRDSPYMLLVANVKTERRKSATDAQDALFGIDRLNVPRSDVPAVTHVDYSARVQTVDCETNPRYHALLEAFKAKTGCPVIVNTSFNVRGEPIVCTPTDAFHCFMGTDLDCLAIGNCFLRKAEQNPLLKREYADSFEPD